MREFYLLRIKLHLLLVLKDDLLGVLRVERVVLQVGAVQDLEELLVDLNVQRPVSLVPANQRLRRNLLIHRLLRSFLRSVRCRLLVRRRLLGLTFCATAVWHRRRGLLLFVCLVSGYWILSNSKLLGFHDLGPFGDVVGLQQMPLRLDPHKFRIRRLNMLFHLSRRVVHVV